VSWADHGGPFRCCLIEQTQCPHERQPHLGVLTAEGSDELEGDGRRTLEGPEAVLSLLSSS
jgi:hypothetical protein